MSNADVYLHIKNDNVDPSHSMALCDQMLSAPVIWDPQWKILKHKPDCPATLCQNAT